ncbi:MAG: DALR anticodon-binding domain-containing protein, partial [Aquificaceae bacterium]
DPYGMKRLAHGLFAILEHFGWDIDLSVLLESYTKELEKFLEARLEAYLDPYGYDLVRAVLEVKNPLKPYEIISMVKTLASLREEEEFKHIVEVYRRVVRILPSELKEDMVEEGLITEKEERELWEILKSLENTQDILSLYALKEPINRFFDKVLVMDPREDIRKNRLALLYRIKKLFNRFADFSKIVIEGG